MSGTMPIITISREYGAGGRSIAKGLSKELGIPWYDRDFVRLTAKISGYSEEEITDEGETISGSTRVLNSILNNMASYTSSHDAIYQAQKEAILGLAKSPCIIVGRCSNAILQEAGVKSFDVFLYADPAIRVERARTLVPENVSNVEKYVEKIDEQREKHYKLYTGGDRNKAQNYTVCLDTGIIDYDTCIHMLAQLIRGMEGHLEEK